MNIFDAAKAYGEGKLALAKFNLAAYEKNPTGIGEHGDLATEVVTIIKDIAEWQDYLDMVETLRNESAEK